MKELVIPKPALEAITLYANGLYSLTDLVGILDSKGIIIQKIDNSFVANAIMVNSAGSGEMYMHLIRLSGELDANEFPIHDETCVVNL